MSPISYLTKFVFVIISISWISLAFITISNSHLRVDQARKLPTVSYFQSDKFRICDHFNIMDFFGLHHDFQLSFRSRPSKPSAQCHPFPLSSLQPKCLHHGYLMTRASPLSLSINSRWKGKNSNSCQG